MSSEQHSRLARALPPPIEAFVQAINRGDLQALLAAFADDALVNDQLQDHWGIAAIGQWALDDIIHERIRLDMVSILEHYGQVIVAADADGAFDKRGLPDPLRLAFHFLVHGDKIVKLIILQAQTSI